MLKTIVVRLRNAVDQGKDETLECQECVIHENCFQRDAPLILTEGNLLSVGDITGQTSNSKDEMQLR